MKNKLQKLNTKSISIILILIMLLQVLFSTMLSVYAAEPDTTWQNDWKMTLDDENGIIMIGKYNGTETKYKVPSKAIIDGKEYATVVGNSGSIISNSQVEELSFEEGVKICPSNNGLFTSNKLTKIDFNGVDFSDVTSMSGWFSGCSNLKEVDLSNIKADNLTTMSSMFENCTNLKSANLSGVKLNKLESTENMFKGCTSLTSVNMKGFSAANVTNENHMFANCTGLKEIEVEGLGIICSGLEEVEDEEYGDTYYEETHIFDGCTNLKHLKLKNIGKIESGSLSNTEFGEPQITIEELTLENCKVDKGAFNYCNTLTKINFKGQNNVVEEDAFYVKPGDRRNLYTDYKDDTGNDRKNWGTTQIPTSFLPTQVTNEDPKLDDYNWAGNNRYVADETKYKLTYNLNGASGSTEIVEFSAGDCVKEEIPEREEYNFYGWNTKQNGAGKMYEPNEQILESGDLELFAQWRKKGYTNEEKTAGWAGENVRWEFNDGTIRFFIDGEGDGKMYNQICADHSSYSSPWGGLNIKNVKFEEGITYIGTYALTGHNSIEKVEFPDSLEEIGTGAFYYSKINEVVNLKDTTKFGTHPFSTVTETHDIVLDANGGKFENNENTKTYSTDIDLNNQNYLKSNGKIDFEEPTKEGYKFVVWNTRSDGTGKSVAVPYYPTIPVDSKFYAIWSNFPITVTYDKNGGNFPIENQQMFPYENISDEEPTKDGYLFAEWNTQKDGTGKSYWPGDKIDSLEDITLYAIYGKKYSSVYVTDHEGTANITYKFTDGDEDTVSVFGLDFTTSGMFPNGKDFVEVSQDYLKKYLGNDDLTEDDFNRLKTLLATSREYDEAGLESSLTSTKEWEDSQSSSMLKNLTKKTLEPLSVTSISGRFWNLTRDLRMEYVYDHFDEIGSKYRLRVFKSGDDIFVAIEPRVYEVEVIKTDILGDKVKGAHFEVINQKGKVVKEWDSSDTSELVELGTGTFTLREVSVSDENVYVKANDIVFSVDSHGVVTVDGKETSMITMVNMYKEHEVLISKTGLDDKEIAGVELEVTGRALGRETDIEKITWTTEAGKSKMISLEPGTYTLHESKVPDGYIKSEDITFKVDIYGKVTIGEKGEEKVVMKNDYTKVDIEKVDEDGNLLAGATLQILDKDGNVVEEWKSEEKAHSIVAKLVAGEKYTLHELYAPEGYEVMENVEFTVSEDGSVDKVKAVNKKVVVPETPKEEEKEEPVEESKEEIKEEVKEEPVEEKQEEKQEEKSPQTGDKIAIAFAVLAIGVAGVVVTRRRK